MIQTDAPETCALGLDARTVSAWRDGATAPAMAERIAAHFDRCRSCQAHMAAFESVAEALRRQRLPGPRPTFWREIQARRASTTPLRWRPPRVPRVPRAPLWGGAGAVAAALIVALLFVQILSRRVGGTTDIVQATTTPSAAVPSATASTVTTPHTGPLTALTWQPAAIPGAAQIAGPIESEVAVAPSDGNTAYVCYSGTSPEVRVTHDRGATWTHVSDVAGPLQGCQLTVDALDSSIVLASTYPLPPPTQPPYSNYVSFDGGATWHSLGSDNGQHFESFATYRGITVALRDQTASLLASSDRFATWAPIDETIAAAHQRVQRFWMNPADGSILAETAGSGPSEPVQFWLAGMASGPWARLGTAPGNLTGFVVQRPRSAGAAWHLCGVGYDHTPGGTPVAKGSGNIPVLNDVRCSTDGGATWQEQPVLAVPHATSQAQSNAIPPQGVFAIADDGSVLAVDGDFPASGTPALTLYVLLPGASAWGSAGSLPGGGNLLYATAGIGGVVWMLPGSATTGLNRGYYTAAYLTG